MRGCLLSLAAVPRVAGCAIVAAAIIAATLHVREAPPRLEHRSAGPAGAPDPLSQELKRCKSLAARANAGAACEAAWAENRRRFFTYEPGPTAVFAPDARAEAPGR